MSKTRESSSPKARKPRAKAVTNGHPSQEEIALRAYHIYLSRNGTPGNAFEDWARAERELTEQKEPARKSRKKAAAEPVLA